MSQTAAAARRSDSPPATKATATNSDITIVIPEVENRLERRLTLVITILPFLAVVIAIPVFWNRGIGVLDLSLFLAFYVFSGMGVTIGFHRYFTHRSFKAKPWVRAALAVAGSFSVQGSIIKWVADHRRHHAFSDQPGDPHSPHLAEAEGFKGVVTGLWHAHIGWFFDTDMTNIKKYAPDLIKDKVINRISRLTPLWIILSFTLPALIGLAVTRTVSGMLTALLWGSLVRIFFLHHITWSINSICHFFGKRTFEVADQSTNNLPMALLSFGEGWHNNHHAFPTSAVHGFEKGQLDPSGFAITLMERLGLVYDVKRPSAQDLAEKRRQKAAA
ncbi:MAG TPA: acyl-CoA desaturase [Actinomycetota bacterium]|nr:acyl-CoA desaturase [Actinomycetota bacterium]